MSIKIYPTIYFALISLLITHSSCAKKIVQQAFPSEKNAKIAVVPSTSSSISLRTLISFKNTEVSGITIIKQSNDTTTGVFINEFGLKGFEFIVSNGACKISHLIKQLDKWYIKETLANDFAFIFTCTYNPNNATTIQKTINKQQYNYYLNPNFVLFKMERFTNNKLSGQIELQNDSSFVITNTKKNIHYKMSIIDNQN
ncbi:MAG: hypothetical protein JXQ69_04520 [Paludibacteraceae bacterium]|nr:hypothetical protein [Paludibacteraceae bacterium]MBN2787572.1 hypothetical protein [Paludibacteraceae bacterium]